MNQTNRENPKNQSAIDGGIRLQNIKIINGRGEKLAAIIFRPGEDPHILVIICHGFRGGKENGGRIYPFAERLNQLGVAVIAFDFGGSGESEGEFSNMTLSGQSTVCGSYYLAGKKFWRKYGDRRRGQEYEDYGLYSLVGSHFYGRDLCGHDAGRI
jgi:pimeloyl-ACP methyl ester carboxylesterase